MKKVLSVIGLFLVGLSSLTGCQKNYSDYVYFNEYWKENDIEVDEFRQENYWFYIDDCNWDGKGGITTDLSIRLPINPEKINVTVEAIEVFGKIYKLDSIEKTVMYRFKNVEIPSDYYITKMENGGYDGSYKDFEAGKLYFDFDGVKGFYYIGGYDRANDTWKGFSIIPNIFNGCQ